MNIPLKVRQQWEAFEAEAPANSHLTREATEAKYPDLIAWIKSQVSLTDLLEAEGFTLEPFSPDSPDVLVARGACPCGGDLVVKS